MDKLIAEKIKEDAERMESLSRTIQKCASTMLKAETSEHWGRALANTVPELLDAMDE